MEEERSSWGRHLEFVFTCIGFAVGLGNVWRFPHLTYSNGGGAFLIPYTISLVFMGIPLFCLEVLFGQFASLGPITIWKINPMLKGLGYTMTCLSAIITLYYNIVVSVAFYFFFASMASTLPWTTCGNNWNTCACRTNKMNTTLEDPMMWYKSTGLNCTGSNITAHDRKSASQEYFYNHVLEQTSGIHEAGIIKWDLTLCNFLAWTIICISLIKGIKTMGKAAYFFALCPYFLLFALIIRGITLEGASDGVEFYLSADFAFLKDSKVWKAAASQIFFSLSTCTGSLQAMSSYNQFKNNFIRDSTMVPIINCLTSFVAGFAVFSALGFMAARSGKTISRATSADPGLIFVVYSESLGEMPLPQFWSVTFYLMLICLGLGTQFPSWETVLTAFQDEFPYLRGKRISYLFRISACFLGFFLGLPMTTQGGFYLMDLLDIFVGFPLLLVGFVEVIAIVWVYGYRRFHEDVMLMIGDRQISRKCFNYYFFWNLLIVTPLLIFAIIIFECVMYVPITSAEYPPWSESLGWLVVIFIMMWTPVFFFVQFFWKGGAQILDFKNLPKLCWSLNQPTVDWGPALAEDRTLPRYQRKLSISSEANGKESEMIGEEKRMQEKESEDGIIQKNVSAGQNQLMSNKERSSV